MPASTIQKYQNIAIVLGLFIIVLGFIVFFAPYGGKEFMTLREDIVKANSDIAELQSQNQKLKEEIQQLKNDSSYVEKIAREKFGMIKKNEIVFEAPATQTRKE